MGSEALRIPGALNAGRMANAEQEYEHEPANGR
jgi:hypothetical protein